MSPNPSSIKTVEWEELPPLPATALRRQLPAASYQIAGELLREAQSRVRATPVWTETLPAVFDPPLRSAPLADSLIDGLATREILEPDVFRHFFAAPVAR